MKKWFRRTLLLCLLAALLCGSIFAAEDVSGICDPKALADGYALSVAGEPVEIDGKLVYPGTERLSLTCKNPAAGENLVLVQTDTDVPTGDNLVYIDQKTGSADFEIYPLSLKSGVTYYVYISNASGKNLVATFSYYKVSTFPGEVTGSYAVSETNPDTFVFTVAPVAGAEYSKDGETWQDSSVFDGIEPGTTLTFYARIKADGSVGQSQSVTFSRLDRAEGDVPSLTWRVSGETGARTVTITPVDGAEYSFAGGAWQDENTMENISADTITVSIRYRQTPTLNASAAVKKEASLRDMEAEAKAVDALIKKLPAANKVKLEHDAAITEAKEAYDALTEEGKALVTPDNVTKLEACVAALEQVKKDNEALLKATEEARALMEQLPENTSYVDHDHAQIVNDARTAYDKLDKNGKALLKTEYKQLTACEKTLKKNDKAVQKARTKLAKLPDAEDVMTVLSLSDKKNVTAAEKAYNALTEDQLTFLTEEEHEKMRANSERMQTLIEGETLIKAAEKAIKSLPADTKIKATDSKKLETAQEAYDKVKNSEDGLTIDPKLAEKFEASEKAYYEYEKTAQTFRDEYLSKLPEDANAVSVTYVSAIPDARTAYKALSKNVQSFIEKAEVSHLSACEKTLKKNQSAAQKVIKLIDKITADYSAKDIKAIDAAWKAYEKLTNEQKTFLLEKEQFLIDCYNTAHPEG